MCLQYDQAVGTSVSYDLRSDFVPKVKVDQARWTSATKKNLNNYNKKNNFCWLNVKSFSIAPIDLFSMS